MLRFVSALKGYKLAASDGEIGHIADFLFDDRSFVARWLVVDTGGWLSSRKVLLQPASLGKADPDKLDLSVALTRTQIEGSPELSEHEPVSTQMERHLYDYYGWEPMASEGIFGDHPIASRFSAPPLLPSKDLETAGDPPVGDPHLRSLEAITGYGVIGNGADALGKLDDLLVDDATWAFPYLVVDVGNWWAGKHVLISRHAVRDISWSDREIRVEVSRAQVEASPAWTALGEVDPQYEKDLHDHYGWPDHR